MGNKFVGLECSAVSEVVVDDYTIVHTKVFVALFHVDHFNRRETNLLFAMNEGRSVINE
jgi:hypothetical protein